MKSLLLSATALIMLCLANPAHSQTAAYSGGMKTGLDQSKAAKTAAQFSDAANFFERIAGAEKTQWLPAYYAALNNFRAAVLSMSVPKDADAYFDKALADIETAGAIKKNESEILALKGQINYAKLGVDPMARYMTLLPAGRAELDSAQKLNPNNPRVDLIRGQTLLYTPEQYGGGKVAAKPFLQSATDKFSKFKPESEFAPNWGVERCKDLLDQASK